MATLDEKHTSINSKGKRELGGSLDFDLLIFCHHLLYYLVIVKSSTSHSNIAKILVLAGDRYDMVWHVWHGMAWCDMV